MQKTKNILPAAVKLWSKPRLVVAAVAVGLSAIVLFSHGAHAVEDTAGPAETKTSEQRKKAVNQAARDAEASRREAELASKKAETAKQRAEKLKQQVELNGTPLTGPKLEACKKREKNINDLMGRISVRGQKQLDLITDIATRTQTYVTTNNLTVANYAALLAEVQAKKAAAQAAVDAVKNAKANFACDATDPKGAADIFKALLDAQNEALKAYREAVKQLLIAVKTTRIALPTTPLPKPPTAPPTPPVNIPTTPTTPTLPTVPTPAPTPLPVPETNGSQL